MKRDQNFRQAAADQIRRIQSEMQELVGELREIAEQMQDAHANAYVIQSEMQELVGELREIAEQMQDAHANAYVVAQLECLISDEHSWLSRDFNLARWIEELESDAEADN